MIKLTDDTWIDLETLKQAKYIQLETGHLSIRLPDVNIIVYAEDPEQLLERILTLINPQVCHLTDEDIQLFIAGGGLSVQWKHMDQCDSCSERYYKARSK